MLLSDRGFLWKAEPALSAPAQSTSPILCLALSVSEPVFLACPLSLLLNQLGGSRFTQFYHFQLSTVGSHWEVTGPQKGSLVSS